MKTVVNPKARKEKKKVRRKTDGTNFLKRAKQ